MKKTTSNLVLLNMIFVVCLVIANVVSSRILYTPVSLFGNPVTLPGAALCYGLTFLATDVISQNYGKEEANRTVRFGFIGQLIATGLIMLTGYLPAAAGFEKVAEAYDTLLGQSLWFCVGSMVAYLVSQSLDVTIFHKVRDFAVKKTGSEKHRWLQNNISTTISQFVDTAIFITIAFGFGMKLPWNVVIPMMIGQYVFKFILALCDTPFFYLMTRDVKEEK